MTDPKIRIIVVDDDARLRELLNRYLSEQGYSVRAVADGNDMNRWLARERYDLEGLWGDAARVKSKSKPAKVKLTARQASKKRIRKAGK